MTRLPSLLLLLLAAARPSLGLRRLHEQYGWQQVEFEFPSEMVKQAMIKSGDYVVGNAVPLDVDAYPEGNRVFVSLPRLREGTPATVTEVVPNSGPGPKAPLLRPFPDWSWQRQGACDGLTSVFRIQVDTCGRLWALDTGRVNILTTFSRICQPQIVVFDLRNGDRMAHRHRFPDSVAESGSLPVTLAVDVRGAGPAACSNAFAYAADVTEYGLLVFDLHRDKSWRVEHKYFYPYPTAGTFTIAGDSFDLMDGVLGLALSPQSAREGGDRRLYFHALASFRENWVSADVLRNASNFENGINRASDRFRLVDGERPSQAAAEAVDSNGVLFYSLLNRNSLNCWTAATGGNYAESIELDRDDQALQFMSGIKVIGPPGQSQEVWLLTCRFQKLMVGDFNPHEVNFRVLRAPVPTLVKGTKCDVRKNGFDRPPRPVLFPGPTSGPRYTTKFGGGGSGGSGVRGFEGSFSASTPSYYPPERRPRPYPSYDGSGSSFSHRDSSPTYSAWWVFTFHPRPCEFCGDYWKPSDRSRSGFGP